MIRSFLLLTLAAAGVVVATLARAGVQADVIYGRKADLALTADVFTPDKPNGAAVVHVANGGWHRAHDDPATFAELTRRGYVVFRVVLASEPKFTVLEQMPDVSRAIRFARANAGRFGIDPSRIGIEGASSGGHMALLGAFRGDAGDPAAADPIDRVSSRVRAAAAFFPLTDLLNFGGPGLVQDGTLGPLRHHRASFAFTEFDPARRVNVEITDPARKRELLRQASPITYVSKDSPPTLLIHGDRDDVVPLQQSVALEAKMKAAGVPAALVVRKGGGHPWPDFWTADGRLLADWFDTHLRSEN